MNLPPPNSATKERIHALGLLANDSDRSQIEILTTLTAADATKEVEVSEIAERLAQKASRSDVIQFLKKLDQAEAGEFIAGRHNKNSRFKWRTCPSVTADIFLTAQAEKPAEAISEGTSPESHVNNSITNEMHGHRFLLRPGLELRLDLPMNLSAEEARRLADFVLTLPF